MAVQSSQYAGGAAKQGSASGSESSDSDSSDTSSASSADDAAAPACRGAPAGTLGADGGGDPDAVTAGAALPSMAEALDLLIAPAASQDTQGPGPGMPAHGIEGLKPLAAPEEEIREDETIELAGRVSAVIGGIVVVNVCALHLP